jgi:hypothetical protein
MLGEAKLRLHSKLIVYVAPFPSWRTSSAG